tara:strand:+ start:1154 stop:1465 length:312 start_codon:yes stop_codon:yes gene_type:complete
MASYFNIIGSTLSTVELKEPEATLIIKSILITNVHDTADATVTLFIQDDPESGTTRTFNIIHTIAVPADSSLYLDDSNMFNFGDEFGLYVTVGSSDTVDIIIN